MYWLSLTFGTLKNRGSATYASARIWHLPSPLDELTGHKARISPAM
jgi:hypothetical protein